MATDGMAQLGEKHLVHQAVLAAQSLRSPAASPRHLLLVLLKGPPDDPARRALLAAGLSPDQVRGVTGRTRRRGVLVSPALMQVDAFAQGLAIGRGVRQATTTDHLLSLCWHPDNWLDDSDPRPAIVRTLQSEGAWLPSAPLPHWDPVRFTQQIEIDRSHLEAAIALLRESYPIGVHPKWGFNYRGPGKAELAAEDGIDLESIAADAAVAVRLSP